MHLLIRALPIYVMLPIREIARSGLNNPSDALNILFNSPREFLSLFQGEVAIPNRITKEIENIFDDTEINEKEIMTYLDELRNNKYVKKGHGKLGNKWGLGAFRVPTRCFALYILVRHYRPAEVIETGSFYGHSTLYILAALYENSNGHLHTFDVHPDKVESISVDVSPDFEPGYMVPNELKSRWSLHLGDINVTLEPELDKIGVIDMFFHDSNHNEEHKQFEYKLAKKHLRSGGILSSHDVGHNNDESASFAFIEIADEMNSNIHACRDFQPGDDESRVFAFFRV